MPSDAMRPPSPPGHRTLGSASHSSVSPVGRDLARLNGCEFEKRNADRDPVDDASAAVWAPRLGTRS